jgi:hypothetical protein
MAEGCKAQGWDFIVAGDSKSPAFELEGCRFLSLEDQRGSGFELGVLCPEKTYARKNLGYLEAMRSGAEVIVETDDDNLPQNAFWAVRDQTQYCRQVDQPGWVNAYAWFSGAFIYPRGMPLNLARSTIVGDPQNLWVDCPIQQGLADGDPDVDAVYRMLYPLPFCFDRSGDAEDPIFMEEETWCPFNSQNTTWFKEVFPLMYLPTHCSFRMCDIWRSFVAQRIAPGIMFHGPTVYQERNEHDLHKDFLDEIPGYVHNESIRAALMATEFPEGSTLYAKLLHCYGVMISNGWVGFKEMELLRAWIRACQALNG